LRTFVETDVNQHTPNYRKPTLTYAYIQMMTQLGVEFVLAYLVNHPINLSFLGVLCIQPDIVRGLSGIGTNVFDPVIRSGCRDWVDLVVSAFPDLMTDGMRALMAATPLFSLAERQSRQRLQHERGGAS
jgi:hypothetical protein